MMVPQLVNCSTLFAGMLEEARAAESKRGLASSQRRAPRTNSQSLE
jgi:hypothetical protein